ncbi:MAG: hypothetical protein KKD92_14080 [Proteobacteria bacterium]|nr:hypothetical protein [Pseudomonadota bacterium]
MRTALVNGELVYVIEGKHVCIPYKEHCSYSEVQIIKHGDLVNMLNDLFKKIEKNMDASEKKGVSGPEYTMFLLLSLFVGYQFGGQYRLPIEIKNKEAFVSDDLKKIKKKKMPKLFNWNRVKGEAVKQIGQFKIYRGGLLKGL